RNVGHGKERVVLLDDLPDGGAHAAVADVALAGEEEEAAPLEQRGRFHRRARHAPAAPGHGRVAGRGAAEGLLVAAAGDRSLRRRQPTLPAGPDNQLAFPRAGPRGRRAGRGEEHTVRGGEEREMIRRRRGEELVGRPHREEEAVAELPGPPGGKPSLSGYFGEGSEGGAVVGAGNAHRGAVQ